MAILNISAVLYGLGWALLHSLWQMGILWVVYQLFLGIPKKWSPAVKHNGSLILLFIGFAWFLVTGMNSFQEYILVKQYVNIMPLSESIGLNTSTVYQAGSAWTVIAENIIRLSEATLLFLEDHIVHISAVYLFVLVLMMFRFTNAYLYANQLKKKGLIPAGNQLEDRLAEWTSAMGIYQPVHLFLSHRIDIPATIGFLKPVILLPVASVNQLSMNQVESIILHELAHIRRMDYLWNISATIIETILFFNPFVYLLTSVQKKERELCCDDFVLGFSRDPHNYATALLELEKTRMAGKAMLAMASNGQDGQLLSRVKRILNIQTNKLQYRQRFIALLFITALMSALAWLQPVQWKKEKQVSISMILPSPQQTSEINKPVPTISDLVKKQVSFDKPKNESPKKMPVFAKLQIAEPETEGSFNNAELAQQDNYRFPINENAPFFFNAPPPPAEYQLLQNEMNLNAFELARPEIVQELAQMRKRMPVYFNQAPQPNIQEHLEDLEKQYKNFNNGIIFQENLAKEFKSMAEMRELEKNKEMLNFEKAKKRIISKRAPLNMIFINGEPVENKVVLDGEQNYVIRIETDDETIEINVGSDSLNRKVIKMPGTPLRPVTIRSADTYPRNRY